MHQTLDYCLFHSLGKKDWHDSWQGGWQDRRPSDPTETVSLIASEPFQITAGQGADQLYEYSLVSGKQFSIAQGQRLKIKANHISDFSGGVSGHTIKLVFQDFAQHTVEAAVGDTDGEELVFAHAGIYTLTIQNDADYSVWYSLTMQA